MTPNCLACESSTQRASQAPLACESSTQARITFSSLVEVLTENASSSKTKRTRFVCTAKSVPRARNGRPKGGALDVKAAPVIRVPAASFQSGETTWAKVGCHGHVCEQQCSLDEVCLSACASPPGEQAVTFFDDTPCIERLCMADLAAMAGREKAFTPLPLRGPTNPLRHFLGVWGVQTKGRKESSPQRRDAATGHLECRRTPADSCECHSKAPRPNAQHGLLTC